MSIVSRETEVYTVGGTIVGMSLVAFSIASWYAQFSGDAVPVGLSFLCLNMSQSDVHLDFRAESGLLPLVFALVLNEVKMVW